MSKIFTQIKYFVIIIKLIPDISFGHSLISVHFLAELYKTK